MRPANIEALRWLKPPGVDARRFAGLRAVLENLLSRSPGEAVYGVNSRSIYRTSDPATGPLAIKELRFETGGSRWRATTIRRHRVLCEFRAQAAFAARGGNTPELFGAALEFDRNLVARVFILMAWIDQARTLTDAVRNWTDDERQIAFPALAQSLVAGARSGLVHGRHSSENILVTDPPLDFHVIDFSHAQIFRDYEPAGFQRDVARIGARLLVENACPSSTVDELFDEVASAAPKGSVRRGELSAERDRVLNQSKRRQRLARKFRTLWRGWPFRLHG